MSDKIARRDFLGSVALVGAAAAAGQNFITTPAKAAAETANPIITSSASELAEGDPLEEAFIQGGRRGASGADRGRQSETQRRRAVHR